VSREVAAFASLCIAVAAVLATAGTADAQGPVLYSPPLDGSPGSPPGEIAKVRDRHAATIATPTMPLVCDVANHESRRRCARYPASQNAGCQTANGSVRVTAGQPLVGIANNAYRYDWDKRFPVIYGDSFVCYEGTSAN